MTLIDEHIEKSCLKVGLCWYPFFIIDGKATLPSDMQVPALIQEINDSCEYLDNGNIRRTVQMFAFDKAPKEINQTTIKEEMMVKQERLTTYILELIKELNRSPYKFRLQGNPQKSHSNMPIWNVGQDFTLIIEYAPCQI